MLRSHEANGPPLPSPLVRLLIIGRPIGGVRWKYLKAARTYAFPGKGHQLEPGTVDTFIISFLTGKATIAGSITGVELLTKVALYYFHERIWAAKSGGETNRSGPLTDSL